MVQTPCPEGLVPSGRSLRLSDEDAGGLDVRMTGDNTISEGTMFSFSLIFLGFGFRGDDTRTGDEGGSEGGEVARRSFVARTGVKYRFNAS